MFCSWTSIESKTLGTDGVQKAATKIINGILSFALLGKYSWLTETAVKKPVNIIDGSDIEIDKIKII